MHPGPSQNLEDGPDHQRQIFKMFITIGTEHFNVLEQAFGASLVFDVENSNVWHL